jgi:hypothetical protein
MAVTWKRLLGVGDAATDLSSGEATTGQVLMADGSAGASWVSRRYTTVVGDGTTLSYDITHNLNTTYLVVAVWDTFSFIYYPQMIYPNVEILDANSIRVYFSIAPFTNSMRVVILC